MHPSVTIIATDLSRLALCRCSTRANPATNPTTLGLVVKVVESQKN